MLRRIAACTCLVTLGSGLWAQEAAPQRPRTIRTVRLMSSVFGTIRTFGLLLPPDYDQTTRRYPVLYLLHGSTQQHSTWGRPALLANTTHSIVVMPDMDRARYALANGNADTRDETFVVTELVDYIDSHYRTVTSRDARAIGGVSIGGFGAMLLGLRHTDRFAAIGAFSAPYQMVGDQSGLGQALNIQAPQPVIYFGCGLSDSLIGSSRRFAALLDQEHIEHRYEEGPGAHTWDAWDWQLRSFLKLLPWAA